jgi:hypothetical protein
VHRVRIVLGKSDLNDSDTRRNPGQRTDSIVRFYRPRRPLDPERAAVLA